MKKNPIGKYLLQNWYYYVFAFGSMALSVFLDMLAPLVTLHIVDDVLVGHKMELLWKYLAAFLLIGAAKALFQYIKEFLFDVSSVRVASQMRDNLFRHVQRLANPAEVFRGYSRESTADKSPGGKGPTIRQSRKRDERSVPAYLRGNRRAARQNTPFTAANSAIMNRAGGTLPK